MAHRMFTDSRGVTWDVWEVEPSSAERRQNAGDRRRTPRPGPDRRQVTDGTPRVRVSVEFTHGWLTFQSGFEKRRLAPVPDEWDLADESALEQLLAQARVVGKPRRLIE